MSVWLNRPQDRAICIARIDRPLSMEGLDNQHFAIWLVYVQIHLDVLPLRQRLIALLKS